jgi:type I restriction enzyme S subunit
MALAGDILLSVRAPVGDINIAVEECCIGRGLCAIRPNKGIESFVFYQLLSLKSIFDIYNGEGTVFGSINKKDLKDIKVILPDEDILIKFDNLVSMFDQEYKELDKESRNLISIRDTLLPKLMSGEIRVPIDNEQ